MKIAINLALFSVLVLCCTSSESNYQILGKWECISWINQTNMTDKCDNDVTFNFNEDNTYTSKIGSVNESGDYKIKNSMLYVTPNGKIEFRVEISKCENDTLVFSMNQAGDEEILTLISKKE